MKWDYELRDARHVNEVVDRALTVAQTDPKGPVYLTLPREVLAGQAAAGTLATADSLPLPTSPQPERQAVKRLAERIARATMPVIVSAASGADPSTVPTLVSLCERFGIGYAEDQGRYVNFPVGHALHLGYDLASVLSQADVLCFLECDVPWIQAVTEPRADAFVVHCGVDPGYGGYPMRSHRSDLSITTAASAFLDALATALETSDVRRIDERRQRIAAWAARQRAAAGSPTAELSRDAVAATVARALGNEALFFNEYWAPPEALARTRPQTYFFLSPAGGLGWGLPAALGAQLAAPERTCVALVGDGAYLFANPAACHHVAARYELPVLTVIYNNARWGAVDAATRMVYPQGEWRSRRGPSLSDLAPIPALERYVEASGGFGARVTKHEELGPALERALHAIRVERRQAVLNVLGS